jgi:hypothetical protein
MFIRVIIFNDLVFFFLDYSTLNLFDIGLRGLFQLSIHEGLMTLIRIFDIRLMLNFTKYN